MLKPFLQDVVQFGPLARVLAGVTLDAPLSIPPLLLHVGILPLADWLGTFLGRKPPFASVAAGPKRVRCVRAFIFHIISILE